MSTGGEPQDRVLWLLRHAKAATDPPPGGADHDRPLAPRGRRDAAALSRRIGAGDLDLALDVGAGPLRDGGPDGRPSYVLCSTARRTTETAQAASEGLGLVIDRRARLYYATPDDVLAELRTIDDGHRAVLVVGHNPATQVLAVDLLCEETPGRSRLSSFPTCGLAVVRFGVTRWQDVAMGTGTLAGFFVPPYDAT